jgi:predicted porin
MKRKLLPLAISAAVAVPGVVMAGEPTVYGRADLSLNMVDIEGAEGGWVVSSNSSRLGVKGDAELNDSLKAVYKMEFQVDMADEGGVSSEFKGYEEEGGVLTDISLKNSANLKSRNQYVGLAHDTVGTFLVGRMDTPLKTSQGKVDLFGDHAADIGILMSGEIRTGNVMAYVSPTIADSVTITVAVVPGEEVEADEGSDADTGLADATSISAVFSQEGIYAAIALDSDVGGWDRTRLVGQYSMDNIKVGGIYQMAEVSEGGDDEETSIVIEGGIQIDDLFLKAAYGTSEYEEGNSTTDETLFALGVESKLGKKTKVYGEYASYEEEQGSVTDEYTALSFGIQHNF